MGLSSEPSFFSSICVYHIVLNSLAFSFEYWRVWPLQTSARAKCNGIFQVESMKNDVRIMQEIVVFCS